MQNELDESSGYPVLSGQQEATTNSVSSARSATRRGRRKGNEARPYRGMNVEARGAIYFALVGGIDVVQLLGSKKHIDQKSRRAVENVR
jgi:hypothetical protein